jgi:hypothetical protein
MVKQRKPIGWPKLMVAKRLKTGAVAYYWDAPSWAKKNGCTLSSEALGGDYAAAKQRCDELLNPQFDAWRNDDSASITFNHPQVGTFDWLVATYKALPKYGRRPEKTRKSYDSALRLVSQYRLKDGRRFGSVSIASIKPATADVLFDKLRVVEEPVLDNERKPIVGNDGAQSCDYASGPVLLPSRWCAAEPLGTGPAATSPKSSRHRTRSPASTCSTSRRRRERPPIPNCCAW